MRLVCAVRVSPTRSSLDQSTSTGRSTRDSQHPTKKILVLLYLIGVLRAITMSWAGTIKHAGVARMAEMEATEGVSGSRRRHR